MSCHATASFSNGGAIYLHFQLPLEISRGTIQSLDVGVLRAVSSRSGTSFRTMVVEARFAPKPIRNRSRKWFSKRKTRNVRRKMAGQEG